MLDMKISFIGCGNIASAIISGVTASGYISSRNIFGYDVDKSRMDNLISKGIKSLNSPQEAGLADFTFITIKPQTCADVLPLLCGKIRGCVVSVVAGMKIDMLCNYLGNVPIVRVMPNTPIMVGSGAAGLCKNSLVSDNDFEFVKGIFDSCGISCVVSEDLMNAVTGISGSGPAYVFRFAKAMCEQAQELGMAYEDALKLVCGTLRGGAQMLENSGMTADELIKMVSSPNGTTVAGLAELDRLRFDESVKACVMAAAKRSEELSR